MYFCGLNSIITAILSPKCRIQSTILMLNCGNIVDNFWITLIKTKTQRKNFALIDIAPKNKKGANTNAVALIFYTYFLDNGHII